MNGVRCVRRLQAVLRAGYNVEDGVKGPHRTSFLKCQK